MTRPTKLKIINQIISFKHAVISDLNRTLCMKSPRLEKIFECRLPTPVYQQRHKTVQSQIE